MFSPSKPGPVRVRLAPSPTGPMHLGTARTAIFNWLFARKNKGAFVLRVEDTDIDRSEKKYETEILEGLKWLGIDWDEGPDKDGPYGPYRQSERGAHYKKYLEKLLAEHKAYYCYCTKDELEAARTSMMAEGLAPKYNGHCRNLTAPPPGRAPQVIRFKTPEKTVEVKDLIRGKIAFDATLIGDFVIAKSTEAALYNFAVVIDDEAMKISHVIRGEDHLSNTPKQILIEEALSFSEPHFAHLPLILSSDRSKMSKRYADTALAEYRARGYLPEALVNFLAILGWHPSSDQELFTREELVAIFDIARIQKAGAVFNQEKLNWMNAHYIKRLPKDELMRQLVPFLGAYKVKANDEMFGKIVDIERERMRTLDEFKEHAEFFFRMPDYEAALLIWKDDTPQKAKTVLEAVRGIVGGLEGETLTRAELSNALSGLIGQQGKGSVLWSLRVALSGLKASPDPIAIAEVLGKAEAIRRLDASIKKINA